jgi:hypothetical protein
MVGQKLVAGLLVAGGVLSGCGMRAESDSGVARQRSGLALSPMKLLAGDTTADEAWTRVDLPQSYTAPIVIATLEYDAATGPAVARVRNAGGSSFELRVARMANSGAALPAMPVHYVVAEAGVYGAASGIKMEAATFTSTVTDRKGSWSGQARSYQQAYTQPIVLGQVQSANDARPSAFWSRGSSSSAAPNNVLRVGKHVGEDSIKTRANETVGYLVIEAGSGSLAGVAWQAGLTPLAVKGVVGNAPFAQSWSSPGPATTAVTSQAGMNNGNGSFALLTSPAATTSSSLRLNVDEDNFADAERTHGAERVAYLALNPCPSPAAAGQACGNGGACRADQTCCPDADADGVCDDVDVCPGSPDRADADADGVPDGCDVCSGSADGADADADGVPDGCDVCAGHDDAADTDADGVPDGCDICLGYDDTADQDGDGKPDGCDRDANDCAPGLARPGVLTGDQLLDAEGVSSNLPLFSDVWCIAGNLDVRGTSLGDLQGLRQLVAVTGRLGLYQNTQLQSLSGLDALAKVGLLDVSGQPALTSLQGAPRLNSVGGVMLSQNPLLVDLRGLEHVTTTGALLISQSSNLVSLHGLEQLVSTSGILSLANNPKLTDLSALLSLHQVGVDLWLLGNATLPNLHGLEGLTSVGRTVRVSQHASLSSIQGLAALTSVGDHLDIFGNPLLDSCAVTELTARTAKVCSNCDGNLACAGGTECSSNACVAGACGSVPSAAGSACSSGVCDGSGACVSPVKLDVFSVSDGSINNPPSTQNGVFNPGDEVSLSVAVVNDGDTAITQLSPLRVVSTGPFIARASTYPVYTNSVAAHGRGTAFPSFMLANDAPLGQAIAFNVEVDFVRDGVAETLSLPRTLVVGPGTPAPGSSVSLELVRMTDGHYLNSHIDGHFAPGEIISIDTRVRNWVRATATVSGAYVTTSDPYVVSASVLGVQPAPYGSLAPSDTKFMTAQVTLSPDAPIGHVVELTVNAPYQVDGESGSAGLPVAFTVSVP